MELTKEELEKILSWYATLEDISTNELLDAELSFKISEYLDNNYPE